MKRTVWPALMMMVLCVLVASLATAQKDQGRRDSGKAYAAQEPKQGGGSQGSKDSGQSQSSKNDGQSSSAKANDQQHSSQGSGKSQSQGGQGQQGSHNTGQSQQGYQGQAPKYQGGANQHYGQQFGGGTNWNGAGKPNPPTYRPDPNRHEPERNYGPVYRRDNDRDRNRNHHRGGLGLGWDFWFGPQYNWNGPGFWDTTPNYNYYYYNTPAPADRYYEDRSYQVGPENLDAIIGAEIWGADGTFLGIVSRDRDDRNSIANRNGAYGSFSSPTSIFNPRSEFGLGRGPQSCWDPDTESPPRLFIAERFVAYLSANRTLDPRVDPNWLIRKLLPTVRWE